jgi:large subunit ribosomal protein L10
MMNRQEKAQIIETLKSDFENSPASFLVDYKGLTVSQMAELRKRLRKHGGSMHVAKITLVKRALQGVPHDEEFDSLLGDQLAFVFVQKESPAIAKVLCDFSNECGQLKIVGGMSDAALLTQEAVKVFASLPSREVLLAKVCGTLQAPLSQLVYILNGLIEKPLLVLKQIEKQK